MSSILRVALTGGIGSGKSTIASKFQELGATIIDSDVISRDIVAPDKPCLNSIIDEFGSDLLNDDQTLNREKLRDIIFNDGAAKKILERILHPVIYQEIEAQASRVNYPYCLIVIPLLIETQTMNRFDRILLVDIAENLQLKRVANRDKTSNQTIEKIIKSQANRQQRLKYATDIIDNNLTIEELSETVTNLHEKYLKLSGYNHEKN